MNGAHLDLVSMAAASNVMLRPQVLLPDLPQQQHIYSRST